MTSTKARVRGRKPKKLSSAMERASDHKPTGNGPHLARIGGTRYSGADTFRCHFNHYHSRKEERRIMTKIEALVTLSNARYLGDRDVTILLLPFEHALFESLSQADRHTALLLRRPRLQSHAGRVIFRSLEERGLLF